MQRPPERLQKPVPIHLFKVYIKILARFLNRSLPTDFADKALRLLPDNTALCVLPGTLRTLDLIRLTGVSCS